MLVENQEEEVIGWHPILRNKQESTQRLSMRRQGTGGASLPGALKHMQSMGKSLSKEPRFIADGERDGREGEEEKSRPGESSKGRIIVRRKFESLSRITFHGLTDRSI